MEKIRLAFLKITPFLPIVCILLLGAFLRIYKISEYLTFLGDEGRDVLVVKRIIVDHKFTLLGPTASVGGFFLGPIYYYFMLPFLWLWRFDPTGPAIMVALFGVATIYIVYQIAKRMFGEFPAVVSASLYALSPVVISYSRSSWNPNVVPFFSSLCVYLLLVSQTKPSVWKYLIIGASLGIGIQLHYLFIFFYVFCFFWLVVMPYIQKRHIRVNHLCMVVVGIICGSFPFLLFELRHGFPNTQSIIGFLRTGKDTGFDIQSYFQTVLFVSYRLFGRLLFRLPDEGVLDGFSPIIRSVWKNGTSLVSFVAIAVSVFGVVRWVKRYSVHVLLLCWYIIPLILFGLYKRDIYDYYLGIIFPVPFLLFAAVIHVMRTKRIVLVSFVCFWIFLLALNWDGRPYKYPGNNQLGQTRRIAETALALTGGKPFNFALLADFNSDHAYRYFFEIEGNAPVTIENVINDPDRKTVTDQLVIICELPECRPLGHPLWEIAGFGRAEIVETTSVPFVTIFKLIHYKEP